MEHDKTFLMDILRALKQRYGSLNAAYVSIYTDLHPGRSVAEVARALGLSRDTVRRLRGGENRHLD